MDLLVCTHASRRRLQLVLVGVCMVSALIVWSVPVHAPLGEGPLKVHAPTAAGGTSQALLGPVVASSTLWRVERRSEAMQHRCRAGHAPCDWLPPVEGAVVPQPADVLPSVDPLVLFRNRTSQLFHLAAMPLLAADGRSPKAPEVVQPARCFEEGNVTGLLIIGHSHLRYVAAMLCMMLRGTNCHVVGSKRSAVTVFDTEKNVSLPPIVFVQTSYQPLKRLQKLEGVLKARLGKPIQFSHIFYGRGAWDIVYRDTSPSTVADEAAKAIHVIMDRFGSPATRPILYPLHRHHLFENAARTDAWRGHVTTCKSVGRQRAFRQAGVCAAERLNGEVFDVWRLTSDPFGEATADLAGHHYVDITLEGLVQLFLQSFVCRTPETPPLGPPAGACRELDATATVPRIPICSCHWETFRMSDECASIRPFIAGMRS